MPQLVNSACAICLQRIASDFDAGFCRTCGLPVHSACRTPAAEPIAEGACRECGAAIGSRRAIRERLNAVEDDERRAREQDRLRADAPTEAEVRTRRQDAHADVITGVVAIIGSLLFTVLAFAVNQSMVILATGAIAFGLFRIVRGLKRE